MPRRNYHHGDLKSVILAQAAALVAERGADGISLRELARAAGVSHAAPAHHFTARRGLFSALATEGFTLLAPKLARTPGNHEMNIDRPTFLFPDKNGERWRSRSATGWVNGEGSEVRLRGNVILDNPQGAKKMRMETEALNVFPDANRATSDQQVAITQPGATIRGRGLEAQLDTQRVILKSEVRARYASSIQ